MHTVIDQTFSWHNVWRVYKGKDAREEAALFKVMKRQDGLALDVCMASVNNRKKEKNMGEFYVGGRFLPTFYMGGSVVATVCFMIYRFLPCCPFFVDDI